MFDFLKNATQEGVKQALEDSAYKAIKKTGVEPDNLSLSVEEGLAIIKCSVSTEKEKRSVIDSIKGIKGIKKIRHTIKVEGGAEEDHEEDSSDVDNGEGIVYVVRPGDSMWAISEKFLGNGAVWMKIYEANKELIGETPELIHPGYELKIPELG